MKRDSGRGANLTAFKLVRAGQAAPDTEQAIARSRPFAAAVAQLPFVLLFAHRDESNTSNWLIAPGPNGATRAAEALASAVGARLERCEPPDITGAQALAIVDATPAAGPSHNTQSGGDPTELAMLFARAAQPGQWVAIALRKPTGTERDRARRWWHHRLSGAQTHYHLDPSALVASVYAGGDDAGELKSLLEQIVVALPGFDVETKVRVVGNQKAAAFVASAIGLVAGWATAAELHHTALAVIIGAACWVIGVALGTGAVKLPGARLASRLQRSGLGALRAPPKREVPPRRPGEKKAKDGSTTPIAGSYPLHRRSFVVSPAMVIGLASPQAGKESDVALTTLRRVPAALTGDIGPLIGWGGNDDSPVHLDASQAWSGLGITGLPGAGKSAMLHALWGWHCLERTSPSGKPGRPGRDNAMVVIEPKPDGVPVWLDYADVAGDEVIVVNLADPSSPAIDLFAIPGTPEQRVSELVEVMIYAWPPGDIQGRGYESLTTVLEAVLTMEDELPTIWQKLNLTGPADVMRAAHCLLGGYDDDTAVAMATAFAQATSSNDGQRYDALRKLGPYFGRTVTPSQRRTATESARNKTKILVQAGTWWSPERARLTWDDLLSEHKAVVIATGPTPEHPVSEKLTAHMSAMLFFAMRSAIMRTCAGWQAAGRSVSVFVDELSVVAESSGEVAAWLRSQGRSYGVRTFFATQYLEQLSEDVRNALLSSETLVAYRQGAGSAQKVAAHLAVRSEDWTAADLTGLGKHMAVLATIADGQPQPPVPVRVGYWDDDPKRLAVDQGYASHDAGSARRQVPDLSSEQAGEVDWDWMSAYRGGGQ